MVRRLLQTKSPSGSASAEPEPEPWWQQYISRRKQRQIASRHDASDDGELHMSKKYRHAVRFEMDTYCQFMLRFIQTVDVSRSASFLSFFHALMMYAVSICVEIVMTAFLYLGVRDMQWDESFHASYNMTVLDAATLLMAVSRHELPVSAVPSCVKNGCVTQLNVFVEHGPPLMVGLWVMFVMSEVKDAVWFGIHLFGVDTRSFGSGVPEGHPLNGTMLRYRSETGTADPACVQRLRPWLRNVLLFLVPGMRLCIILCITFAGIKFIVYQHDPLKMVLKSLCMRFVFRIDELLIRSTSTQYSREMLRRATIMTSLPKPDEKSFWERGAGAMILVIVIIIGTYSSTYVLFADLMFFRRACFVYNRQHAIEGVRSFDSLGSLVKNAWVYWEDP